MSIDDITGYSWRRAVGAIGSGIALATMLYVANPQVAYSQGGRDVDVVMKGGKLSVSPKLPAPTPSPAAPATPKALSPASAVGKASPASPQPQPKVEYGTYPSCGASLMVDMDTGGVMADFGQYQCLTPAEAKAKGIDPNSGLSWKKYTAQPGEACPGQESCYKLPAPAAAPEPTVNPLDSRLGGIERRLEEMGKAELERQRLEEERRTEEAERLRLEREATTKSVSELTAQLTLTINRNVEQERQARERAAEPLVPFSGAYLTAEVLSGDARGTLAAYGAGAAFRVADKLDLEIAGGMLQQYGDLEQRTSPDPSTERRLLPDGTTYKLTEDSTTTLTTDEPTGFFGRVRGSYHLLSDWLRVFAGADVRGREEGETATDYQKTISLERNDRPLRNPKTIRDQETTDSSWNAGVYTHGGIRACIPLFNGPVTGCFEAQGGYDFHTASPNYGGGVRLGFE